MGACLFEGRQRGHRQWLAGNSHRVDGARSAQARLQTAGPGGSQISEVAQRNRQPRSRMNAEPTYYVVCRSECQFWCGADRWSWEYPEASMFYGSYIEAIHAAIDALPYLCNCRLRPLERARGVQH